MCFFKYYLMGGQMPKGIKDVNISETLGLIEQNNEAVESMLLRWSFLRSPPKFSDKGPVLSPKKGSYQSEANSPLSLEALRACQASGRMSVFTPPTSPSKKAGTQLLSNSPYSQIGPS